MKCFFSYCIKTSKAEGGSGTKVDFSSQNGAAQSNAWCQGAVFCWLSPDYESEHFPQRQHVQHKKY